MFFSFINETKVKVDIIFEIKISLLLKCKDLDYKIIENFK